MCGEGCARRMREFSTVRAKSTLLSMDGSAAYAADIVRGKDDMEIFH